MTTISNPSARKWDRIYFERGGDERQPASFLERIAARLPRRGRALDVAGGSGRNALWLARHGLDVTCADISRVGLAHARSGAVRAGLALKTVEVDLESGPLPEGPWDVIVCFHFLHRPLLTSITDALAPGGYVAAVHPTVRNLERHERPSRRFLLEVGELAEIIDPALEILIYSEGWSEEGRHEVELLGRRVRPEG